MVLPPGAAPVRLERIDGDDYEAINRLVDGHLGNCPLPPSLRAQGFYAFCDDNALIRADAPAHNRFAVHLGHFVLRGPIVLVRTDSTGETLGLRPRDIASLELYFHQATPAEALRAAELERQWWAEHPSGVAVYSEETDTWQDA